MTISISKLERLFIEAAILNSTGVFDYENCNEQEFIKWYGMTKEQSYYVLASLKQKINPK